MIDIKNLKEFLIYNYPNYINEINNLDLKISSYEIKRWVVFRENDQLFASLSQDFDNYICIREHFFTGSFNNIKYTYYSKDDYKTFQRNYKFNKLLSR